MTRRLVLIRHAKAGDGAVDHERPLAARGHSDATDIGRWLADRGIEPDRVVVSTARRTRQTWALVCAELASPSEPEFDERIYYNIVDDLLDVVRETPAARNTVVLVGHNPAVQEFAIFLDDGAGDAEIRRRVHGKFPTSAVAIIDFDGGWGELDTGAGPLTAYGDPGDF